MATERGIKRIINMLIELIIKIFLFVFCIIIKQVLVRYMKRKNRRSTLVEMWMNGAIIVSFLLILISVYRLNFL